MKLKTKKQTIVFLCSLTIGKYFDINEIVKYFDVVLDEKSRNSNDGGDYTRYILKRRFFFDYFYYRVNCKGNFIQEIYRT